MDTSIIPMIGFGWQELLIILVIAMLLFGGSRLAGIGKSSGRAIREFKEETRGLKEDEKKAKEEDSDSTGAKALDSDRSDRGDAVDAEVVESPSVEKNPDDLR